MIDHLNSFAFSSTHKIVLLLSFLSLPLIIWVRSRGHPCLTPYPFNPYSWSVQLLSTSNCTHPHRQYHYFKYSVSFLELFHQLSKKLISSNPVPSKLHKAARGIFYRCKCDFAIFSGWKILSGKNSKTLNRFSGASQLLGSSGLPHIPLLCLRYIFLFLFMSFLPPDLGTPPPSPHIRAEGS